MVQRQKTPDTVAVEAAVEALAQRVLLQRIPAVLDKELLGMAAIPTFKARPTATL